MYHFDWRQQDIYPTAKYLTPSEINPNAISSEESTRPGTEPSQGGIRTLKSVITTEILPKQIVFEREFPKSMPQQKRDSYFLTEMFNVKSLIRHQENVESGIDLKIRTSLLKDAQSTKSTGGQYYIPSSPEDTTLVFESRYESGNLCLAVKISDFEYNLFMQNDINTQGHTQWFFFRMNNTRAKMTVRFNIMNYVKIL